MLRPEWGVLAAGVSLLFPVQLAIDARRGEPPNIIQTLPPPALLPVLSFGHRETVADLLEIRATTFLMKRMEKFSRMDRDQLWLLYSALATLDPHNPDVYRRGAIYLASVANAPGPASTLLRQGLGEPDADGAVAKEFVPPDHKRRWYLLHELAAIHFMMYANRAETDEERDAHIRQAGQLWIRVGQSPGGPSALEEFGQRFATRGISRLEALEREVKMWMFQAELQAGNELVRSSTERRLAEAQCALKREHLQGAVDHHAAAGTPVTRLSDLPLEPLERIGVDLDDPLGFGFFLVDGLVAAPAYEAVRLERQLQIRYAALLARNGEVRRIEDIYPSAPPPYLEVELVEGQVRVTPRLP